MRMERSLFRFAQGAVWKHNLPASACGTPVSIPASPFMKKLSCGTGVGVYLMRRIQIHAFKATLMKVDITRGWGLYHRWTPEHYQKMVELLSLYRVVTESFNF